MKTENIIQFIKFGIVGVSNTVVSYIVYWIGVKLGLFYLLASVLGFVVSVLNSFYWNNKYVFKSGTEKRSIWKTLMKTFAAYAGTGLILSNALLVIWIEWFEISELVAPIINIPVTTVINFLVNKFWAYRR
ncbi:MAG: GtrA family protein [Acetatifactor sp.]